MCRSLTPVLTLLYMVIIEVYLQCFTELASLREIGKPILRAEINSPNSLYLKAIKEAHFVSALLGLQFKSKYFFVEQWQTP